MPVASGEVAVSINQASAEQLVSILKGIGLKKAESIVLLPRTEWVFHSD